MSAKHLIIAITGSSGAGTTTTTNAIRHIFRTLDINSAGDSFHRFTRPEMEIEIRKAQEQGRHISYFGPVANDFALLENLFTQYGIDEQAKPVSTYIFDEAVPFNQMPGTFTCGRTCRVIQMCYFMKDYTVGSNG